VSKSESRDLGQPYHRVEVADGLDVKLTDRDPASVNLTADDNLLGHINTDVKDGVLQVSVRSGEWLDSKTPLSVEVGIGGVNELGASGAAHVSSSGGLLCDRVAIDATGASRIELDSANGSELVIWASGASQVTVRDATSPKASFQLSGGSQLDATAGKLDDLDTNVSGGSRLQLGDAAAQTAKLDVSGGSTVTLTASVSVTGGVSGGSEVSVRGNPPNRTLDISGGSRVSYEQ
jgi:hypothetical protein